MTTGIGHVYFAPHIYVERGTKDLSFYNKAFGAVTTIELFNDDGSIHVAEFSIGESIFHVHEVTSDPMHFSPLKYKGTTALIGLFVGDVDMVISNAVDAGAKVIKLPKDYDYGYRQAEIEDPFGHIWLIEKKI